MPNIHYANTGIIYITINLSNSGFLSNKISVNVYKMFRIYAYNLN